jgi:hypothetical protein
MTNSKIEELLGFLLLGNGILAESEAIEWCFYLGRTSFALSQGVT